MPHREDRRTTAHALTAAPTSDAVLDAAFARVCQRRRGWSPNADIWSFRRDWPAEKQRLTDDLRSGRFRFGLLDRVTKADGSEADLWSARDALVLKALTICKGDLPPAFVGTSFAGAGYWHGRTSGGGLCRLWR